MKNAIRPVSTIILLAIPTYMVALLIVTNL